MGARSGLRFRGIECPLGIGRTIRAGTLYGVSLLVRLVLTRTIVPILFAVVTSASCSAQTPPLNWDEQALRAAAATVGLEVHDLQLGEGTMVARATLGEQDMGVIVTNTSHDDPRLCTPAEPGESRLCVAIPAEESAQHVLDYLTGAAHNLRWEDNLEIGLRHAGLAPECAAPDTPFGADCTVSTEQFVGGVWLDGDKMPFGCPKVRGMASVCLSDVAAGARVREALLAGRLLSGVELTAVHAWPPPEDKSWWSQGHWMTRLTELGIENVQVVRNEGHVSGVRNFKGTRGDIDVHMDIRYGQPGNNCYAIHGELVACVVIADAVAEQALVEIARGASARTPEALQKAFDDAGRPAECRGMFTSDSVNCLIAGPANVKASILIAQMPYTGLSAERVRPTVVDLGDGFIAVPRVENVDTFAELVKSITGDDPRNSGDNR